MMVVIPSNQVMNSNGKFSDVTDFDMIQVVIPSNQVMNSNLNGFELAELDALRRNPF